MTRDGFPTCFNTWKKITAKKAALFDRDSAEALGNLQNCPLCIAI